MRARNVLAGVKRVWRSTNHREMIIVINKSENPADHTLELMRRMRAKNTARFDRVDANFAEVLAQIRIQNTHIAGLVQYENLTAAKVAEFELRLERVEKRLDLADPAVRE